MERIIQKRNNLLLSALAQSENWKCNEWLNIYGDFLIFLPSHPCFHWKLVLFGDSFLNFSYIELELFCFSTDLFVEFNLSNTLEQR